MEKNKNCIHIKNKANKRDNQLKPLKPKVKQNVKSNKNKDIIKEKKRFKNKDKDSKNIDFNKLNVNKLLENEECVESNDNKVKSDAKNGNTFDNKLKSNKFRDKCFAKRAANGMLLLSANVEKKIYNLKKALRNKGMDGNEIRLIVRQRRRHEENKYNRDMSKGCFKCRQKGHKLADCPLITNNSDEGVDICYRCGSSEHKLSDCSQKSNGLPFAKCFLCSESGHLTRNCRLNKRGIYPKGGSCKACGSVNHLIKDCPQNQDKDNECEDMTLTTLDASHSADADMADSISDSVKKNKITKLIKF